MAEPSELSDSVLNAVDDALHRAKAAHSMPPGNEVFSVLHGLAKPFCDEVARRAEEKKSNVDCRESARSGLNKA